MTKKFFFSALAVCFIICNFPTDALCKEEIVDFHLQLEQVPNAIEYNVKIKNFLDTIILDKTTKHPTIDHKAPTGAYRIKITIKRKNDLTLIESRWLPVQITSIKKLSAPENVRCTRKDEKGDTFTAQLTWENATKPEESVMEYDLYKKHKNLYIRIGKTSFFRLALDQSNELKAHKYEIYQVRGNSYAVIGETSANRFYVRGLNANKNHSFSIRTVNRSGKKSMKKDITCYKKKLELDIAIKGSFVVPTRVFAEKLQPGGGFLFFIGKENLFIDNFHVGFEGGFWYFEGNADEIKDSYVAPLMVSLQYGFPLTPSYRVVFLPAFAFGASINTINYTDIYRKGAIQEIMVEPIIIVGAQFRIKATDMLFATIGSEYGAIFEKKDVLDFAHINISLGLRF